MTIQCTAGEESRGERIDKYLSEQYPDLSRSFIQKLLKSEAVTIKNRPVKSNYKLSGGEEITLCIPDAVEPEILAEPMELDIIYEDRDIILINKPKGMVVHPAAGHYSGTLVNGLMTTAGTSSPASTVFSARASSTASIWIPPASSSPARMISPTITSQSSLRSIPSAADISQSSTAI